LVKKALSLEGELGETQSHHLSEVEEGQGIGVMLEPIEENIFPRV
jgi:hypothetical protein